LRVQEAFVEKLESMFNALLNGNNVCDDNNNANHGATGNTRGGSFE